MIPCMLTEIWNIFILASIQKVKQIVTAIRILIFYWLNVRIFLKTIWCVVFYEDVVRCSHKLMHKQGSLITSVVVLTSAYYQSNPITSVGVFNKNDFIWHVLWLGTISLITKCRSTSGGELFLVSLLKLKLFYRLFYIL